MEHWRDHRPPFSQKEIDDDVARYLCGCDVVRIAVRSSWPSALTAAGAGPNQTVHNRTPSAAQQKDETEDTGNAGKVNRETVRTETPAGAQALQGGGDNPCETLARSSGPPVSHTFGMACPNTNRSEVRGLKKCEISARAVRTDRGRRRWPP